METEGMAYLMVVGFAILFFLYYVLTIIIHRQFALTSA